MNAHTALRIVGRLLQRWIVQGSEPLQYPQPMHPLEGTGLAAQEFPKWIHAGPKVLAGLVRRRAAEQRLFLG